MATCEHLFLGKCMISAKPAGKKVPSQCGKPESHLANWWSNPFISWDSRDCLAKDNEQLQNQCDGFEPVDEVARTQQKEKIRELLNKK